MAAELQDEDVAYLDTLPFSLRSEKASRLMLYHGSPRSSSEGLGPWSSDERLQQQLDSIDAEVLVCAHTHRPMERPLAGGMVINVGAVGLPFNGDRRAQYAIVSETRDEWQVEFRQVDYDLARTLEAYDSTGFLEQGGVTARLLRLELEHAAPFLVPFLKWAEAARRPAECGALQGFFDFYDPRESVETFWRRLERLAARGRRED